MIFVLKGVMIEIQNAGWKQCGQVEDKSQIQEEEILALFNMIDKDGSGSLTKRVNLSCKYLHLSYTFILGNKESCKTYQGQVWN